MKVFALKDLPDGTPAGRVVDLHPDAVTVLALPGVDAVRLATDEEEVTIPVPIPRRGAYRTRALRAGH